VLLILCAGKRVPDSKQKNQIVAESQSTQSLCVRWKFTLLLFFFSWKKKSYFCCLLRTEIFHWIESDFCLNLLSVESFKSIICSILSIKKICDFFCVLLKFINCNVEKVLSFNSLQELITISLSQLNSWLQFENFIIVYEREKIYWFEKN
jgi:hypothetical protein